VLRPEQEERSSHHEIERCDINEKGGNGKEHGWSGYTDQRKFYELHKGNNRNGILPEYTGLPSYLSLLDSTP